METMELLLIHMSIETQYSTTRTFFQDWLVWISVYTDIKEKLLNEIASSSEDRVQQLFRSLLVQLHGLITHIASINWVGRTDIDPSPGRAAMAA